MCDLIAGESLMSEYPLNSHSSATLLEGLGVVLDPLNFSGASVARAEGVKRRFQGREYAEVPFRSGG